MQKKLHIKKGDIVKVIAGNDNGKQGKVLKMIPEKQKAVVEGIRMMKKHAKPDSKHPQGGIVSMEAPMHISNLMLVDPKTGEATRTGRKISSNGKLVRYSKKSGEEIK